MKRSLGRLGGAAVLSWGLGGCSDSPKDTPSGGDATDSGAVVTTDAARAGDAPVAISSATFHKDVEPILQQHCQGCHTAGGIAPFALKTYEDAKPVAALMVARTGERAMPPWGAVDTDDCKAPFAWKNDPRLSDAEIATIAAWKAGGLAEGDPADAPAPIASAITGLSGAELTLTPTQPYQLTAKGQDAFRCFVLDPHLTETKYVSGAFVVPGNAEISHHALVYLDPKGASASKVTDGSGGYDCFGGIGIEDTQLLSAWAPGGNPFEYPDDVGQPIAPGTLLVLQMHYHPHVQGAQAPDASSVQLRFTKTEPTYHVLSALIGNFQDAPNLLPGPDDTGTPSFMIPAGAAAHTESMSYTFASKTLSQAYLYSVGAHMHYVGSKESIRLTRAGEAQSSCLLSVPKWDFDWQRLYSYDTPIESLPVVKPGDRLDFQCTYNNTPTNPKVAASLEERGLSAPTDIHLGESTLDEMCISVLSLVYRAR